MENSQTAGTPRHFHPGHKMVDPMETVVRQIALIDLSPSNIERGENPIVRGHPDDLKQLLSAMIVSQYKVPL